MKKIKLLELIRFLKRNNLIEKYNSIYKEYDERLKIESPGFDLKELFSLTDEQANSIINSNNLIEALFKLRTHDSYGYDDLLDLSVSDNEIALHIIEDIWLKLDIDEYDKDHRLIKGVCAQTSIRALERIDLFFRELSREPNISSCGLDLETLMCSLGYAIKSECDEGADLILSLSSKKSIRDKMNIDSNTEYYAQLLNVISQAKYAFQVSQIEHLIKKIGESGKERFLDGFESSEDEFAVLTLFTKTTNERAGEELILMLEDEQELIKSNPKLLLTHLEVCANLRDDEEFVMISDLTAIDELEYALMQIQKNIEIDENTKVRVKRKNK